jgi:hypothetical protein
MLRERQIRTRDTVEAVKAIKNKGPELSSFKQNKC